MGRSVRDGLTVAALALLLFVPPLGRHIVAYSGEARMALLARDMLERGVLFDAWVEGRPYRNKPPLYPWSIALASWPGGRVTEATAQLPVTVAAVATALVTWLLGARLFGRRAGLWAGLALVTSASFFAHSQVLLPDMLVTAFATAALYAFWRAVSVPPGRLALVGFWTALAFAVFSKGPMGLLPLAAALVWLWTEHGLRGLGRLWSPAGLGVFAVVTLVWLGPFLAAGTRSFGGDVVQGDWFSNYLGWPSPGRIGRFLRDALVGFLPWSLVFPVALLHAAGARRDPAVRWALLSCLVPLGLIVLSHNRLPVYLLPVYPAGALLVAWWADVHGTERGALARGLGWLALVAVVAALGTAPFVPEVRRLLLPDFAWQAALLGACVLALGLVLFLGLGRGRPALLVYGGVLLMAVLLSVGLAVNDEIMRRTQDFRLVAAALHRHAAGGEPRVLSAPLLLAVDFYYGRPLERLADGDEARRYLARPERPIVLTNTRHWREIEREAPGTAHVVETIPIQNQDLLLLRGGPRP